MNGLGKALVALASVVVVGLAGWTSIAYASVIDLRQQIASQRQEDRASVKDALAALDEKVQRDIENLASATKEARETSDDNRLRWERSIVDVTTLRGELNTIKYRLDQMP